MERILGYVAAAALFAIVLGDLWRRQLPGQPIAVTVLPLLIVVAGAGLALLARGSSRLPGAGATALGALGVMCAYGTLIAVLDDAPTLQIVVGWIAEAALIPAFLVGWRLAQDPKGWQVFVRAVRAIAIFSIAVALLQQFGLLTANAFEMLEDASAGRGLQSGGYFRYTNGPFRTANVFSFFCAFACLVLCYDASERADRQKGRISYSDYLILLALLFVSVLAARRTGMSMLLGALLPLLFLARRSMGRQMRTSLIAALLLIPIAQAYSPSTDLREKVLHASVESGVTDRLLFAVDVRPADWRLISLSGQGIGASGPGEPYTNEVQRRNGVLLIDVYPILHVGWFKYLYMYGPLGVSLEVAFFGFLFWFACRSARRRRSYARWSAAGFLALVAFNHFFVSTSWIHGLSGGLFLGLGLGAALARLRYTAPDAGATVAVPARVPAFLVRT